MDYCSRLPPLRDILCYQFLSAWINVNSGFLVTGLSDRACVECAGDLSDHIGNTLRPKHATNARTHYQQIQWHIHQHLSIKPNPRPPHFHNRALLQSQQPAGLQIQLPIHAHWQIRCHQQNVAHVQPELRVARMWVAQVPKRWRDSARGGSGSRPHPEPAARHPRRLLRARIDADRDPAGQGRGDGHWREAPNVHVVNSAVSRHAARAAGPQAAAAAPSGAVHRARSGLRVRRLHQGEFTVNWVIIRKLKETKANHLLSKEVSLPQFVQMQPSFCGSNAVVAGSSDRLRDSSRRTNPTESGMERLWEVCSRKLANVRLPSRCWKGPLPRQMKGHNAKGQSGREPTTQRLLGLQILLLPITSCPRCSGHVVCRWDSWCSVSIHPPHRIIDSLPLPASSSRPSITANVTAF